MSSETLTSSELALLKEAGVRYPWDPRKSLELICELKRLRRILKVLDGNTSSENHWIQHLVDEALERPGKETRCLLLRACGISLDD